MTHESLGAKIRRLRGEKKISQDRLALEAHVDQSGLSKFERGQAGRMGPAPLSRIAAALGMSVEDLVNNTDHQSVKPST